MSRDLGFLQARQGNQTMLHIHQMLQANYKEKIYHLIRGRRIFMKKLYGIVSFCQKHIAQGFITIHLFF